MTFRLPTPDKRKKTIQEFLAVARFYSRKDRLLYDDATYRVSPPPWNRGDLLVGLSFGLKSRAYLFPDYFVFLTTWTDDEQTRSNLEFNWFIRTFTLEFLFEYLGDLTLTVLDSDPLDRLRVYWHLFPGLHLDTLNRLSTAFTAYHHSSSFDLTNQIISPLSSSIDS